MKTEGKKKKVIIKNSVQKWFIAIFVHHILKMTEKTATEASNDFWLAFKAEKTGKVI
jgi:hypothetical protein